MWILPREPTPKLLSNCKAGQYNFELRRSRNLSWSWRLSLSFSYTRVLNGTRLKQAELQKEDQENRRTSNDTTYNGKKKKKSELSKLENSSNWRSNVRIWHRTNFQDIKVIDRDSNRSKLETIETLHIKTTSNNINKKDDLNRIKNCYDGILCKIRKIKDKKLMPDRKL